MTRRIRLRTGDQSLVREINLSVIMNQLREHAPISRATLAELTGLNKTTVSSLVQELIDHQYIHEVGLDTSGVGRPAILLELNPQAGCMVSAEVGVDFITVLRTNFSAEPVWQHKEPHNNMSQQQVIDRLLALLTHAAEEAEDEGGLMGLALGVPGLVDYVNGSLLFAPNLKWHDVQLGTILREAFPQAPVFVDNEANLAALGEYYFGAAQGYDEVLYVSVGVGLGGGIVRNGTLFRGKTGFAGEFGHMTLKRDGPPCNCGNRGCWETLVSQAAVYRLIKERVDAGQTSTLLELTSGDLSRLTVPLVVKAARSGDKLALDTLEEVGHYLGIGIASLVNALDPDLVVFGGILSLAADFVLEIMQEELAQRTLNWDTSPTQVVLARHGFNACVMGGVATVYQTILAQPGSMAQLAM